MIWFFDLSKHFESKLGSSKLLKIDVKILPQYQFTIIIVKSTQFYVPKTRKDYWRVNIELEIIKISYHAFCQEPRILAKD